jgi:hypothetical protein
LDATHFRQRAARAREMAQSGDDIRLSRMLLEVAHDLDAEAAEIEAEVMAERRAFARLQPSGLQDARLRVADSDGRAIQVQIIDLTALGAKIRSDHLSMAGSKVTLELPGHGLHLDGVILRVRGLEATVAFDPEARSDPGLMRLLQPEPASA